MAKVEFFKVFIKNESSERMLLPPRKMNAIMEGKEGGAAILLGSDGRKWPVIIDKTNDEWSFREGWKAYLKGNAVVEREVLAFTYVGHINFMVKIFSPGVERRPAGCGSKKMKKSRKSAVSSKGAGVGSIRNPVGRPHVVTPKEQTVIDSFTSESSDRGPFLVRDLYWPFGKFPVLSVPKRFLRIHGLNLCRDQVIGLRNPFDERWEVKVNESQGIFSLGKGFPRFLRKNHLMPGMTLVYEVIDCSSMEMKGPTNSNANNPITIIS